MDWVPGVGKAAEKLSGLSDSLGIVAEQYRKNADEKNDFTKAMDGSIAKIEAEKEAEACENSNL